MAESAVVEELKCSICLYNFKNPKVLPCCHSFCLHCLEGAHEINKDKKSLTCPQCNAPHQVPTNGPCGFLDDYTLVNQKQAATTTPVCEQCDDSNKPVAYCHTCSDYLCDECLKAHRRVKAVRDHKTVNITPGNALDIEPQANKSYSCSVHHEKPLELYCKDCKSLACLLCLAGLHNRHDIGSIDGKARQEVEETTKDLVKKTDSKLTEFKYTLKYVSAVEKEKAEAPIPLKAQVDKKVDGLIQQLEARRKELHKEIDDACTKDLKELWAQKEYHKRAITSMEGALSFARRALACKEDTELLALCAQVTIKMEMLSQLKSDSQNTEKIEMKNVKFKETNEQETDTVGDIHVQTFTPDIKIRTTELQKRVPFSEGCSISFQVTAAVNFKCKTPKLTASATYTALYYDYEYGQDTYKCITEENATANSWTVKFTPKETNTYTITLQVKGQYGATYLRKTLDYQIEVHVHYSALEEEQMEVHENKLSW
ncbi:E3 ubiquitin-protein ligase TRIM33-like isoform X2 [Halichondria panicea]|uniref:E3 ubiquitin-protein ligase TRIM33-like isoform X2 n=1 Tax=Halichondria panicea TaxID=6063 RepID=UPI00312BB555